MIKEWKNAAENGDDSDHPESFKLFKQTKSSEYNYYLSKDVSSDLNSYFDMLNTLDNEVDQGDTVNIKLANYGGDLHSGIAVAHSMRNCKGTVIVHAISDCYSMASLLALSGDALIIYPGNYLMFHNYSGGEIGKAGEIETSQKANMRNWKAYLKYFCQPFLTSDEIASIMSDKDKYVHFDDKDLKKRLKHHFPKMTFKR